MRYFFRTTKLWMTGGVSHFFISLDIYDLAEEGTKDFPKYKKEEENVMTEEIMTLVSENVFGVWFLIGAALVFWMQAGFAMVEAGFTRAKNTGNILMKN